MPHSDFFEGLVGVAGRHYHNLKPETLGARVIPFWEMVYHDCQVCYGKYGYDASQAAQYVAHHLLAARPLHYHSIPDHLYWKEKTVAGTPSDDRACYTRTDQGWAEGLHPVDAFLKTTHEVLGPLHLATAHDRLTRFEFLSPDRGMRKRPTAMARRPRSWWSTRTHRRRFDSRSGGHVVLPPWGFVVEGPRFVAFYARSWNGRDYPEGALFTIRAEGQETLAKAHRVRVFHGFGDPRIDWGARPMRFAARRSSRFRDRASDLPGCSGER